MKFLLIHPPFKHFASVQPPLGLAYLSAVLKKKGVQVGIIDANAERLSLDQIVNRSIYFKPDAIGITVTTPVLSISSTIVKQIKERINVTVIAGGPHPTVLPEESLLEGIGDIVCIGEGEDCIAEIVEYINGNMRLDDIKGIAFKRQGNIIRTEEREMIKDLDSIPFPDWDGFPLKKYFSPARKKKLSLPIMTSRGCPARCYFCYKGIFGSRYRYRSPKNIIDEIEYLQDRYGIEEFSIIDDSFTLKNDRAKQICDLLSNRKEILPWSTTNGIRVSPISEDLLWAMKRAGCYRVFFGAETGNNEILKSICKGVTIEQIEKAVKMAKKVGIEVGVFFMIGNIGENEKTINETIDFSIRLNPDIVQFTIATPYPGTELYNIVKKEGRFLFKSWDEIGSYEGAFFEHGELNKELVERKFKEAYRRFYLRPKFLISRFKKIKSLKDIKNSIYALKILNRFLKK